MFKTYHIRSALTVLVLMLSGAVIAFGDASDTFHQTYRIAAGTPVTVENTNGNVEITTWDKDHAEVHAELQTRRDSDELELVEVSVETNGILHIETKRRRRDPSNGSFLDRLFGQGGGGRWPQVNVNYTIRLPKTAVLNDAATVNGNVNLDRTAGDTSARTTNGGVDITDHTGTIRARSTNGNINVRGTSALIEAKTTNGSIDVEIGPDRTETTTVETVNGSVDMIIPENLNAELNIRTVNGGINANGLTVMLEKISKRQLIGTLGTGGPELIIRTVNGGVDLRTH